MVVKTGFKVVGEDLSSVLEMVAPVRYRVGEWVYPIRDSGPLTCFANLTDTMAFLELVKPRSTEGDVFEVYECDYISSEHKEVWGPPIIAKRLSDSESGPTRMPMGLHQLSTGTVLADCVRLREHHWI